MADDESKSEPWIAIGAIGSLLAGAAAVFGVMQMRQAPATQQPPQLSAHEYVLHAQFASIGDLAVGAPVRIGGARIGTVGEISVDPATYRAVVTMYLDEKVRLPEDSTGKIDNPEHGGATSIDIVPGPSDTMLPPGEQLLFTQGAINWDALHAAQAAPQ
ncbi:MAG TPA: MlaD family protein [Caulobacterales bacterium]|nr:MlaD family protein [Caulobacterales bacterium]